MIPPISASTSLEKGPNWNDPYILNEYRKIIPIFSASTIFSPWYNDPYILDKQNKLSLQHNKYSFMIPTSSTSI